MNMNREATKTQHESQFLGARGLRCFTAQTVLGVSKPQAWRTLKRPEGRAPFTAHDRDHPG